MKFISVFRPINLLIIAITMYLMRWGIIIPFLDRIASETGKEFNPALSELDFFALVISIVLIAAAGYLHNDIMDREEDEINKPGKNIIGNLIDPKRATGLYYFMSTVGLAISYWLANQLGNFHLSIIQLVMAVSLWFYSVQFKSSFLAGNLIVAFLLALVPITVGIYEVPFLYIVNADSIYGLGSSFTFNFLSYWTLGFGAFAFLFTFVREIIKDIEDRVGDEAAGAQTMPIVIGEKASKYVALFLYLVISIAILIVQRLFLPDIISLVYMIIVLLGVCYAGWLLLRADAPVDYHRAGLANKVVSVTGILYAVVVAILLHNQWI